MDRFPMFRRPNQVDQFFTNFFDESLFAGHPIKLDLYEKGGSYFVEADLPGYSKEDIKLTYENGYLTIHAKSQTERVEENNYIYQERHVGEYLRRIYLNDVNETNIQAKFDKGILMIQLEKLKDDVIKNRDIPID